jgi:uncharacterized repeat protein (TIGR03803 family)
MRKTLITNLTNNSLRVLALIFAAMLASNAFGQTLTTLYNFGGYSADAVAPGSGVIADKNGNLFGTSGFGGINGSSGTVFELSPPVVVGNPWTEILIHKFRGTPDGKIAESRLAMNAKGMLVGTTLQGGSNNQGTAYMLAPPTGGTVWKEKILHDFGTIPNDVASPNLGLFLAPEGDYGVDQTGANGFGAVYLLTPAGGGSFKQNILYSFKGAPDAASPGGELVRDAGGNFYGVSVQGGANNLGAVYEVSPPAVQGGAWTETVLYSFNGTDGTLPSGRLLLGAGGILYGTTDGGGANSAGLVFELDPPQVQGNPWTESILYAFTGGADGTSPSSGVIADKKGNLLGTAGSTIFMLRPPQVPGGAWTESVLHTFTGPDGFSAGAPLTLFKNAIYGTTSQAGAFGHGTAYQLTIP